MLNIDGTTISFTFRYPRTEEVFFGLGCAERAIRELVVSGKHRNVMVVTSHSVQSATPLIRRTLAALPGDVRVEVFAGSREHTPAATVGPGATMAAQSTADCLLVVGGSSALDTAKAIALARAAREPADAFVGILDDGKIDAAVLAAPKLPIYSLPTTLSGSEFTAVLGVTSAKHGMKHVFRDPSMTPRKVVLDPEFAAFTPEKLWASTGLKLLDHCVERILANNHNPFTDVQCATAVGLIDRHLESSIPDGPDVAQRRLPLMLALWIAQSLHGNVGVGLSHALAHQLGAKSGVPHGVGSALLLPPVLRFNRPAAEARFATLAQGLGLRSDTAAQAADQAMAAIIALIERLGMPRRLSEAGVSKADLVHIASAAVADPSSRNNPRPASVQDVTALLESIF